MAIIATLIFPFLCEGQYANSGTRKNLRTEVYDSVYYTSDAYSRRNVFFTSYSIFVKSTVSKADTIINVEFSFNRDDNTLTITNSDRSTNQFNKRTIDFLPSKYPAIKSLGKPIYCVKDFLFNDTLLSATRDNNASILFTIADTITPQIFLHQIVSLDGNYRFDLDKFRSAYLSPHLAHASDYWAWFKIDSFRRAAIDKATQDSIAQYASLQKKINAESRAIHADREALLSTLDDKHKALRFADTVAHEASQQAFSRRMDNLFAEYLSVPRNINAVVSGSYSIRVNIADPANSNSSRLTIIRKQTPEKTHSWLTAQLDSITSVIRSLPFENENVLICSDDLYAIIPEKHRSRSLELSREIEGIGKNPDSFFKATLDSIDIELRKYCDAKVAITTVYTYDFRYKSTIEEHKWVVRNKHIKNPKTKQNIENENYDLFYKQYPKAKDGVYIAQLNSVSVNSGVYGPVLQNALPKYKYHTSIGFSMGALGLYSKAEDDTKSSFDFIQYWNVSLIYHHIGVFGGAGKGENVLINSTSHLEKTYLINYSEYGVLLAPGKNLYFKLGLASFESFRKDNIGNAIVESKEETKKPLAGISLMFPVFQLEAGYNFAVECPYVMAGFNIPINL